MTGPGFPGPVPPRFSPAQRLRLARLRWRHARRWLFAHHPLCDRFHDKVFRLGAWRVCRSCCMAWGGAGAMLTAWGLGGVVPAGWMLAVGWAVVLALSWPSWYARLPRWTRDVLRAGAGAGAAGLVAYGVRAWPGAGTYAAAGAFAALAALYAWVYTPRRRRRKARACDGCAELVPGAAERRICSGFARQAADLSRFEEEASALVARWF